LLFSSEDPDSHIGFQVLLDLVNMILYVLNGKDPSALEESIRTTVNSKTS